MGSLKINIVFLLCLVIIGSTTSCGNSKEIKAPAKKSNIPFKNAFHEANSEKIIGHFDAAIALFQKCLVIDPNSAASHFGLAQIYQAQNNSSKAIQHGKTAFGIDETNKWYAEFLGSTYFEIGDYHNSAKFYKLLIDKHNDQNIDNLSKLAQSYIFSNQKSEAIEVLNKMELEMGATPMTSLTKHDLYQELGKTKLADEALNSLFSENPLNSNTALEAMDYFLQTRQYDKAELAINQVKSIDPDNVFAKLGAAEVALSRKQIELAFDLLDAALPSTEIDINRKLTILESLMGMGFDGRYPESQIINTRLIQMMKVLAPLKTESAKFMSLYGRFLMQNNQQDSAQFYFQKAVEVDPNSFDAWINLMDANYNQADYLKVISDANQALTLYPNQPMIYLLKGISEYEIKDFLMAEETLFSGKQLVIDNKEQQAEFDYHLAKTKWQQNEKTKAVASFKKLFELNPGNARFYFGYAQLLYADNKKTEAFQYAKKAANAEPRESEYTAFYAHLLVEDKNYELAQKMIEQAIIGDSNNAIYMEEYGDIMFFQNNIEKAVEVWKEANKMKPSDRLEVKIKTKSYHE